MKYRLVNENFKKNYGENLLRARGIEDVEGFLNPAANCLQDAWDLDNMREACELINKTIFSEAPYALIVDCDCDGYTSSAILYQYLKRLNPNKQIDYFIHDGKQHGMEDMWERLLEKPYCAILIPDAASNDSVYAQKFQCPILVLDHHILENESIAPNMILVNNQTSPKYVNKDLSGAGVTWQFCRALDCVFERDWANSYIDLAALALVGDMMSMLNYENQYIVKTGFKNIKNKFFKALFEKQSFSMGGKLTPITVAFYIVPLINAMIRVGTQAEKERLFMAFIDGDQLVPCNKRGAKGTMEKVAIESARECTNAKSHQDKLKEKIVEQIEVKIFKHDLLSNEILFVRLDDDDEFPAELNGLVAMVLAAKYHKPTILGRLNEEGYVRGSARGVNQSELTSFKDYLNSTGLFEYTAG